MTDMSLIRACRHCGVVTQFNSYSEMRQYIIPTTTAGEYVCPKCGKIMPDTES